MSELAKPWFGITQEAGKYSIISVPVYQDLEVAKEEGRKVNHAIDKVEGVLIYIRMLQDGDPENENPKKILDYIESELTYKPQTKVTDGISKENKLA